MMNWLRWWLACFLWAWTGGSAGRAVDWTPCWCNTCGWQGPRRWLRHGYHAGGDLEDVEPWDYCPRCGVDHIEEAD